MTSKHDPLPVRLGALLGNWNDRRYGPELGTHPSRRIWRRIDRLAGRLYTWGER